MTSVFFSFSLSPHPQRRDPVKASARPSLSMPLALPLKGDAEALVDIIREQHKIALRDLPLRRV